MSTQTAAAGKVVVTEQGAPVPAAMSLEEAEDLLQIAEYALAEDRDTIKLPEIVQAIAIVRSKSRPCWPRFRRVLQQQGLEAEVERLMRDTAQASFPEALLTVGAVLDDAPLPDLIIPPPYALDGERTFSIEAERDSKPRIRRIASAPVLITGRLLDTESRLELLRLSWRRPSGWAHRVVERGVALQARRVVELASVGFPVSSNTAAAMVGYLEAVEAANFERLPVLRVSTRMGWQSGVDGFLWGRMFLPPNGGECREIRLPDGEWQGNAVGFKGLTDEDDRVADGFHQKGTLSGWCDTVGALRDYPRPLLALYASLVPPLLEILNAPNFVLDLSHRTSTGKTSALRAAASVWGRPSESAPDRVVWSWDTTLTGAERLAALISGMPLILDDTKRARQGLVAKMIYQLAHGLGATRGNDTSLARTLVWRTVLLSTGEAPITSFTQDGGTRTRCLVVRGLPFGAQDQGTGRIVDGLNRRLQQHYGHAGPEFVRWLQRHRGKWQSFRDQYEMSQRTYAERSGIAEGGRLSQYAAAIDVAARLAHCALPLPWEYTDPFFDLWEEISGEAADAGGELRALRDVVSWARSRSTSFFSHSSSEPDAVPADGWLGRWEREFLAIHSQPLKALLEAGGYASAAIFSGWRERGWLDHQPGRNTKQVRIGADNPQMIVIRQHAVELAERDDAK